MLFFVTEERYEGIETKSPFKFERKWSRKKEGSEELEWCYVKQVKFLASGINAVGDLFEDHYDEFFPITAFCRFNQALGQINTSGFSNGIDMTSFNFCHYAEAFSFTNNDTYGNSETARPVTKRCNPRLEIYFNRTTFEPINILMLKVFPQTLSIDKNNRIAISSTEASV